jgi:hypothetical protein
MLFFLQANQLLFFPAENISPSFGTIATNSMAVSDIVTVSD